jgi:hypothetical protein
MGQYFADARHWILMPQGLWEPSNHPLFPLFKNLVQRHQHQQQKPLQTTTCPRLPPFLRHATTVLGLARARSLDTDLGNSAATCTG